MVSWDSKVPSFTYMPDSFSSLFVPTLDTTRLTYFLDTLVAKKHYVMFVGNTGEASAQPLCRTVRPLWGLDYLYLLSFHR